MTLAAILLVSLFSASASPALGHSIGAQSATAAKSADATNTPQAATSAPAQDAPAASQTAPSTSSPAKNSAGTGKAQAIPARRRRHKKKMPSTNCDIATTAAGQTTSPGDPASTGKPPTSKNSTPSGNCPPPKTVIRQGGTSEPSIQLAGGTTGNQTNQQRNNANDMLDAADANLKKIAGRQLSSTEQDMVSQIRQFMDQSKTAVGTGDLERARTLAWKAQLLSQELVKPDENH